jgi:hypothetical protein
VGHPGRRALSTSEMCRARRVRTVRLERSGVGGSLTDEQRQAVVEAVRSSRRAQGLPEACDDVAVGRLLGVVLSGRAEAA